MQRKTFDVLASGVGVVVVAVLVVAGALLMWGYSFANNYVTTQLTEQQIYFPPASAFAHPVPGTEITPSMIPSVSQYAGQQLTTGPQAEVYANDFIAVHLKEIGNGKTYAQVSTAAFSYPKGSPGYLKLEATAQTLFQGTTLRGLLLNAYGYWTFGEIAFWAAIAAFCLAFIMAVLVGFGIWHSRRVKANETVLAEVKTLAA